MARKKTLRTNEDLVRDLMNYSPFGALTQAFIMDAIMSAAERTSQADPASIDNALLSGAAWVATAKDIHERCNAFYGRN